MKFKFKPVQNWILVEIVKIEQEGDITLPDSEQFKSCRVVDVGPGWFDPVSATHVPVSVKPGDNILCSNIVSIQYGRTKFLIVKDENIFGVVSRAEETPAIKV